MVCGEDKGKDRNSNLSGENMIDEKEVIKKLQKRIDIFVKEHPELNNSESVESIRDFIHLLEIEAKEQSSRKE